MPIVKFTKENMPKSGEELVAALREAAENTSIVDDLLELTRSLAELELKYKMKSEDFYEQFERGEMGDDVDFVRWATDYEIYQEIKADLEWTLDLLQQYAFPVMLG